MKRILKHLIFLILVIIVCFFAVNAETDFLRNFKSYCPKITEKQPRLADEIEKSAIWLSKKTDYITFEKIYAYIKGDEPSINPNDVAVNNYYQDNNHLDFYPDDYTAIKIDGNKLYTFGKTDDSSVGSFATVIYDDDGNEASQQTCDKENDEFSMKLTIPSNLSSCQAAVFVGEQRYGQFESIVNDYVYLDKDASNNWALRKAVTYDENKINYEKNKSISAATYATRDIQSDSLIVRELVAQITANKNSDYDKIAAIHDWICDNIYYDKDIIDIYDTIDTSTYQFRAEDVIKKKVAVCRGYAYTFAAMVRSLGIPCNVVSGYALGISGDAGWNDTNLSANVEPNHVWNEAYVDGRWIIVDATWNCKNKYTSGVTTAGKKSHIYFDANLLFFSQNHRIIKYIEN